MNPLLPYLGKELIGRQPDPLKMEYELRAGDDLVGTLRFRSSWGTLATAESADGCWTFKRVGFFNTRVAIRACGSEQEVATFRHSTWSSGGTLEFPDGRKFPAATNFWATEYDFHTPAGISLVHYKNGGTLEMLTQVTLRPEAAQVPELTLMTLLGWYLNVMMENDSAAGAFAASAGI